jgi:addiction module HigA family antidote
MNKKVAKKTMIANDLIPADIFHPGDIIYEEMKYRGMSQKDLAEALGLSKSEMSLIINGKRNVTVALAVKLEKVFGVKAETWMNLQMGYEINLMRKRMAEELKMAKVSSKKKASIRNRLAQIQV